MSARSRALTIAQALLLLSTFTALPGCSKKDVTEEELDQPAADWRKQFDGTDDVPDKHRRGKRPIHKSPSTASGPTRNGSGH
jgi:hypothetical protein